MSEKPEIVRISSTGISRRPTLLQRYRDQSTDTQELNDELAIRKIESRARVVRAADNVREIRLMRRLDSMVVVEEAMAETEANISMRERELDLKGYSEVAEVLAHRRRQIQRLADRMIQAEFDQ